MLACLECAGMPCEHSKLVRNALGTSGGVRDVSGCKKELEDRSECLSERLGLAWSAWNVQQDQKAFGVALMVQQMS